MTKLKYELINRPDRKMILKWSKDAKNYIDYVEEIGCGENDDSSAWDILTEIKDAILEPVGAWFSDSMVSENKGSYAHGVEVPSTYRYSVPEGFEMIDLPSCEYIIFIGEPYNEKDEQFVIKDTVKQIDDFDIEVISYKYAYESGPKMQLKPQGKRGYVELRPVVAI